MNLWQICGCALIFIIFSLCFYRKSGSVGFAVGLGVFIIIAISGIKNLMPVFSFAKTLAREYPLAEKYLPPMLKALGIGAVCSVTSDICRENGENTLGNAVEFFGKGEIVILALPFIKELLELAFKV